MVPGPSKAAAYLGRDGIGRVKLDRAQKPPQRHDARRTATTLHASAFFPHAPWAVRFISALETNRRGSEGSIPF